MLETIGNTPLVRLRKIVPPSSAEIWLKIEGLNPTGSYKDRMALAMVQGVEEDGQIDSTTSLLECTGGSTGSSLAFVCAVKGYKFTVISSDAYAREKLDSMRAFGATVLVEPSRGGVVTPDLWPRMINRAKGLVDGGGYIYLNQFNNKHAPVGYEMMGKEILEQIQKPIDAFCGAVGTAGMIMGVGSVIRAKYPSAQIVALEPDSSPVLSGGEPGSHSIVSGQLKPLFSFCCHPVLWSPNEMFLFFTGRRYGINKPDTNTADSAQPGTMARSARSF